MTGSSKLPLLEWDGLSAMVVLGRCVFNSERNSSTVLIEDSDDVLCFGLRDDAPTSGLKFGGRLAFEP